MTELSVNSDVASVDSEGSKNSPRSKSLEDGGRCAGHEAPSFHRVQVALHRVRFAGARLTVGKGRGLVARQDLTKT